MKSEALLRLDLGNHAVFIKPAFPTSHRAAMVGRRRPRSARFRLHLPGAPLGTRTGSPLARCPLRQTGRATQASGGKQNGRLPQPRARWGPVAGCPPEQRGSWCPPEQRGSLSLRPEGLSVSPGAEGLTGALEDVRAAQKGDAITSLCRTNYS